MAQEIIDSYYFAEEYFDLDDGVNYAFSRNDKNGVPKPNKLATITNMVASRMLKTLLDHNLTNHDAVQDAIETVLPSVNWPENQNAGTIWGYQADVINGLLHHLQIPSDNELVLELLPKLVRCMDEIRTPFVRVGEILSQTIIREGQARIVSWWDQYVGSLRGQFGIPSNFSNQAIEEIDRSTDEILSTENIPDFDSDIWDENNGLRIGAAVGSIQSGKTANMIGVAAKGLDKGFKIVIVLGGLKNDLRSQTANRFCKDLLCKGEPIVSEGVSLGLIILLAMANMGHVKIAGHRVFLVM